MTPEEINTTIKEHRRKLRIREMAAQIFIKLVTKGNCCEVDMDWAKEHSNEAAELFYSETK